MVLPAGLVGRDALGISGISASGFGHRSRTVFNDLSRFVSLYDVTRVVARRRAQSLVWGYTASVSQTYIFQNEEEHMSMPETVVSHNTSST